MHPRIHTLSTVTPRKMYGADTTHPNSGWMMHWPHAFPVSTHTGLLSPLAHNGSSSPPHSSNAGSNPTPMLEQLQLPRYPSYLLLLLLHYTELLLCQQSLLLL